MTVAEAAALLTIAATIDNRSINEATARAWHATLADLDFEDAREAVFEHYRRSDKYLMPAHVRDLVKVIHERRTVEAARERAIEAKPALALVPGKYGQRQITEPTPAFSEASKILADIRRSHHVKETQA